MLDVLLVAATERELDGRDGLVCGVGPVEAAAATARALALRDWRTVLHIGVAGGRDIAAGSLVIGSGAIYCDLSAAIGLVDRLQADERLVRAAAEALPGAHVLPIGTFRSRRWRGSACSGLPRWPACPHSRSERSRTRSASPIAAGGDWTRRSKPSQRPFPSFSWRLPPSRGRDGTVLLDGTPALPEVERPAAGAALTPRAHGRTACCRDAEDVR